MVHAAPAGTYRHWKEKYYVVKNGQTMGVFLDWYVTFLADEIDADTTFFFCN